MSFVVYCAETSAEVRFLSAQHDGGYRTELDSLSFFFTEWINILLFFNCLFHLQ